MRYLAFICHVVILLNSQHLFGQSFGKSLDFNPTASTYVWLSGDNDFGKPSNFTTQFTFEAWVKNEGSDVWARVFDFGDSPLHYMFFTPKSNTGKPRFAIKIGNGTEYTLSLTDDFPTVWTHVAITLSNASSNNAKIYLNGVLKGETTFPVNASGLNGPSFNYLGKSQFPNDAYFNGKMDEVRVWNTVRTQAQIQQWMNKELSGNENNLVAYMKMNNGVENQNNGRSGSFYMTQPHNLGKLSNDIPTFQYFPMTGLDGNYVSDSPISLVSNAALNTTVEMDGTDYFYMNNEANFDFNDAYSFDFWLYPNYLSSLTSTPQTILRKGLQQNGHAFNMGLLGTSIFLSEKTATNTYQLYATNAITIDKWQHITATAYKLNGGVQREIYINGILAAQNFTANQIMSQNNDPFTIGFGDNLANTVTGLNGKLSNMRVWNKRLTDADIRNVMAAPLPTNTPNLVAQYVNYSNITNGLIDNVGTNHGTTGRTPLFANEPCFVAFTLQPVDHLLNGLGGNITLQANLVNPTNTNYTIQWKKNGAPIPGATGLSYTISNINNTDLANYRLDVTSCAGQVYKTREAVISIANAGAVLKFDGDNDYITFNGANTAPFQFTHPNYTIEAWVRFDQKTENQAIITLTNASGVNSFFSHHVAVNKDGYFQHTTSPSGEIVTAINKNVRVRTNEWYHVAASFQSGAGGSVRIKVNGIEGEISPIFNSPTPIGTLFHIGSAACGFEAFSGEIDEVRIWSTVTNTMSIPELNASNNANIVHYYRFNNGIAGVNNNLPAPVNTMQNPFTNQVATLYNFGLVGNVSNWLGCSFYNGLAVNSISDVHANMGSTVNISASAVTSTPTQTYQWYKDKTLLSDQASATLTLENVLPSDFGDYYALISDGSACPGFTNKAEVKIKGSGEVLNFDGIDDNIVIQTTVPLMDTALTVEFWVKFEGTVANKRVLTVGSSQGPNINPVDMIYTNAAGKLVYYTQNIPNDPSIFESTQVLNVGQWYHVVARVDNNIGIDFLINGIPQGGIENYHPRSPVTTYYLGSGGIGYDFINTLALLPFKGEIDELRIWKSYRSNAQILAAKDRELNDSDAPYPSHYFRFNAGLADGDNANPAIDKIPDYSANEVSTTKTLTMVGFDLQGDASNWSDCSPVTIPNITVGIHPTNTYKGQFVQYVAQTVADTAQLTFQWRKNQINIPGATHATLDFPNYSSTDAGAYDVIVFNDCDPIYLDTIAAPTIMTACYDTVSSILIDYPSQTVYRGCTAVDPNSACSTTNTFIHQYIDHGYCNTTSTYEGGEVIYKITLAQPQVVRLSLTELNSDVDLFVVGSSCNIDSCYGSSTNDLFLDERVDVSLPIGDSYIIIDTKTGFGGAVDYKLELEMFDTKCDFATNIACGQEIQATTANAPSFLHHYCDDTGYSGSEKIYSITLAEPRTLIATLNSESTDLDLFLLDGTCSENVCLAASTNTADVNDQITKIVPAGTYFIVVDGKNGATGAFDLSLDCKEYFSATELDNDAYVDLEWSIDKNQCVPQDTGIIIKLITPPNTILYTQEFTTAAQAPEVISGTFRHYVGTNKTRSYVLRVTNRLSNQTICESFKTGTTLPFQSPEIIAFADPQEPDSIKLIWRNHSKLSDQFKIFRNGAQIASLTQGYTQDSLIVQFNDVHNINQSTSIQQNTTYNYCVQTYSTNTSLNYPSVCSPASTYNIGFEASDNTHPDHVALTWNSLSGFGTAIKVERNGIQVAILSIHQTFYNDFSPIFGVVSNYSLTLMNGDAEKMEVYNTGSVAPNGLIAGQVIKMTSNYPVKGVQVQLKKDTLINNVATPIIVATTMTDFNGQFTFPNIVYGLAQEFELVASKSGSYFSDNNQMVTLNAAIPTQTNMEFIDTVAINTIFNSGLLDTFYTEKQDIQNKVILHWAYTNLPNDTLTFNLYRDGALIYSFNDAAASILDFTDLTGVPNADYTYTLDVFKIVNNVATQETLTASETYPEITPLTILDFGLGHPDLLDAQPYDPMILFDWSSAAYANENYDGFRIFRDGQLIGQVGNNVFDMTYLGAPDSLGNYQIRAFRNVGDITYESAPYPIENNLAITSQNLFIPPVSIFNGKTIQYTFNPFDPYYPDGFHSLARFDGLVIDKKLTSEPISQYKSFYSISKSALVGIDESDYPSYDIWIERGIPGQSYDYRARIYFDINGARYTRDTVIAAVYPDILAPTNLVATEQKGRVNLSWIGDHIDAQGKVQFDGYQLTRLDLINEDTLVVDGINGGDNTYADFVNNPQYSLFFNNYAHVDYTYKLRSYLNVDGVRYYSDYAQIDAAPLDGSTSLPLPTQFMASHNLQNQIKLCWEWPHALQAQFIVYRDTVPLDTLPYAARAFYDYGAPLGVDVTYNIVAYYNASLSEQVKAVGRMVSPASLAGRIYNQSSGAGIPHATVGLTNVLFNPDRITYTDSAGYYRFEDINYSLGQNMHINVYADDADFFESPTFAQSFTNTTIAQTTTLEYEKDFIDYKIAPATTDIAQVQTIKATSQWEEMNVRLHWSPTNLNYDGFQIYRANTLLGEVTKISGKLTFVDSTGFDGIYYTYGIRTYIDGPSGRIYSAFAKDAAKYPLLYPVENLTATSYGDMNKMLISWSHPFDNHNSYRIRRNGIFVASIPTGQPMMWYDTSGIHGLTYNYEVVAIKGNKASDPVIVTSAYKGVAEVKNLAFSIPITQSCSTSPTNQNHVHLSWSYDVSAMQGFEIYRDDVLIAEIDSLTLAYGNLPLLPGQMMYENNRFYYDEYTGRPSMTHKYHVLAYTERNGQRTTSGIEELYPKVFVSYPVLAEVTNFQVIANAGFGSGQVQFSYPPHIAIGFEILRNNVVLDTIVDDNSGDFTYQDITGTPGQSYTYKVKAYDKREGITYKSVGLCATSIIYPIVPTPSEIMASQGTFVDKVELSWFFPYDAFVDTFYVENLTLGIIKKYTKGKRIHVDITNDANQAMYKYRVRAARKVGNTLIYSSWSATVSGWSQIQVTGNPNTNLTGLCEGNYNGYTVDISGDWAVSGVPGGKESVNIYKRENGGWSLFQTLYNPENNASDFGTALSIDGNRLAIGAKQSKRAYVYEFDGDQWAYPTLLDTSTYTGFFGHSIELKGDFIVVSSPTYNSNRGAVSLYHYGNGIWTRTSTHEGLANQLYFGYGVAMAGNYVAVSTGENGNTNKVYMLQISPTYTLSLISGAIPSTHDYTYTSSIREDNLDMIDDYLAIGDRLYNNQGRVRVSQLANGIVQSTNTIQASDISTGDHFGASVALASAPSPINQAIYLLTGSPYKDISGILDNGKAYLYSNRSGSWTQHSTYTDGTLEAESLYGYGIGLSKDALIIGNLAETASNAGAVTIKNLIDAPTIVSATDGVSTQNDPAKTTIQWTYAGDQLLASGFNIYRDGDFLVYRDMATMSTSGSNVVGSWDDNAGNAGQVHTYTVKTTNITSPFTSFGRADGGYRRANGLIQGSVVTAQGGIPVPGVLIKARGIIAGEVYEYTTTTYANGQYIFNQIYYDNDPAIATQYTITASYLDHQIIGAPTNIAILVPLSDPVSAIVNFVDNTAYVITGRVSQPLVNCSLEGIKITPIVNGVPNYLKQVTTDENGNYSLVINPQDPNLDELRVRIENKLTEDNVTTNFHFIPSADTVFTEFENFAFVTPLDFTDDLTYPISLKVKNTCDDPISTAKWKIRLRTLDGCYDQTLLTNSSGNLVANLLPLNYVMTVVGADVTSTTNAQALDYFANFPVTLNLLDLHRDSFTTLTNTEIAALGARKFTYHKAATIDVTGFSEFFCNQPVAIIQQNETYTLQIDVSEMFGVNTCDVSEGKLSINNPASSGDLVTTISYDPLTESFPSYTFKAGDPNQINPFIYAITVDYLSDDDIFLGRKILGAFVEGSVALPGADIIVNPVDGNNAVPYPVMVLRDPPGDGSSSYITGGQTISYETTVSKTLGGSGNVSISSSVDLFGATIGGGVSATHARSNTDADTYNSELTVSQTISTSDSEDQVGVNADIIIGSGFVMSYGIVYEYKVGNCDTIIRNVTNTISPNSAATVWSYTIGQINDIITGYQNDSIKIRLGLLKIVENGKELDLNSAIAKNISYLKNWREVLRYHSRSTLPHFAICSKNPALVNPVNPNLQNAQIDQWQSNLCPMLGTGVDGNFALNPDLVWSTPIMNMYNAASYSIREITLGNNVYGAWNFPANGNISTILNYPSVVSHFNNFGAPVKNLTVGGAVNISESLSNVNAGTNSHSSSFHIGGDVTASIGIDLETEVFGGVFGGVGGPGFVFGAFGGVISSVGSFTLDASVTIGVEFTKESSFSQTITNSVETGYTLVDDDNTDQFSVAIIQPITQDQTPYFDFFGGRSSCPPEEGSLWIDNPKIAIIDPVTNGTTSSFSLNNVPANSPAVYAIRVENQTPIPSAPDREVKIFLVQETNTNSAIVKVNGVSLNDGNLELTLPAFEPLNLSLTIEKGPVFYQHPNIMIGIEPVCDGGPTEFITVSTNFSSPCSPVSITEPDDHWVINNAASKLTVVMQDYDPENPNLDAAVLQYRRLGSGQPWTDVNDLQLEHGNYVSPDTLSANDAMVQEGQTPKYYYIWTIPNTSSFPDGDYQVRVKMICDNFTNTISNIVSGKLAREGLNLFGLPQPSDHIWTTGDEISYSFTKDLDCPLINPSFKQENVFLVDLTTGDTLPYILGCYANKLIFTTEVDMSDYDGHMLRTSVRSIPSVAGNLSQQHIWDFRVVTQPLYWTDTDTVKLRLYQDETQSISLRLNNSTTNQTINGVSVSAADGTMGVWLTLTDPTTPTFDVTPAGRDISYLLNANQVPGIYDETIQVTGLPGSTPIVHLQLEIITRPPDWTVDPGMFSTIMNMVSNWRFTTQGDTARSRDIKDLVSVWIGNEIRGVANISRSGSYYAAYITIFGKSTDLPNTPLEFRIWDAHSGIEYDAHPNSIINYAANTSRGTVTNPEMLTVHIENDVAHYIPLRQGWTGFSLYNVATNMTVTHQLRSLSHVVDGDILITDDKFTVYDDTLGWYNFGDYNLAQFNNNEGYMIYLANGPDTLRVAGAIASHPNIILKHGWNWIGFPFVNSEQINDVLNLNTSNTSDDDFIKVDSPLPGGSPQFADYNISTDTWTGNLTAMNANNLYKLYAGHNNGAILSWTPQNNSAPPSTANRSMVVLADPSDASTWGAPPLASDSVMYVFAQVIFNGNVATNANDKIAFFKNGEIKGYATIDLVPSSGLYEVSMIVEKSSGPYDIRYYSAANDNIYTAINPISYAIQGHGKVSTPIDLIFENAPCPGVLTLTAADSPLSGLYQAAQEIKIIGVVNVLPGATVTFSAPQLTIQHPNRLNAGLGATIVAIPDGCD